MESLPAYTKPAITVEEQLDRMVSRGIEVGDRQFAFHALSCVSYYRFSAYTYSFRSSSTPDSFVPGTTFEKVWRYYRFDRRLKSVVLDAVERVEIAVRTKLVNTEMLLVIAPQSNWKNRLQEVLAEFPEIHRPSMALPEGFENSPLWV